MIYLTPEQREELRRATQHLIWMGTSMNYKGAADLTDKIINETTRPIPQTDQDLWYRRMMDRMMQPEPGGILAGPPPGAVNLPYKEETPVKPKPTKRYQYAYTMKQRSLDAMDRVLSDKGKDGYKWVGEFQSASTVNEDGFPRPGDKYLIFEREVQ